MNGFLVRRVMHKGKRKRGRFFDLCIYPTTGIPQTTVVCSTKVSKKAVVRNRLQRQIREVLRLRREEGEYDTDHLVAIVKGSAVVDSAQSESAELHSSGGSLGNLVDYSDLEGDCL